jgi:hypothetical protein
VSPAPPPSALAPAIIVLVLFIVMVARRAYRQVQGVPFSAGRQFAFAVVYVLLFVYLAFGTLYAAALVWGVDSYGLVALYVIVPAIAAGLVAPYVQRIVRFERREGGQWYYRLSWHVPALYLALFLVRITGEIVVFGPSAILITFPPPAPPSTAALVVLVVVDLLFGFSLGLLVGRGIGVYRAHRNLPADGMRPQAPPGPPLPGG